MCLGYKDKLQLVMNIEEHKQRRNKVANIGHDERLSKIHNKGEKYAKRNCIRKLIQEEFENEMVEFKAQLYVLMQLIQKREEDHT